MTGEHTEESEGIRENEITMSTLCEKILRIFEVLMEKQDRVA